MLFMKFYTKVLDGGSMVLCLDGGQERARKFQSTVPPCPPFLPAADPKGSP